MSFEDNIKALIARIGYEFKDMGRLIHALTHSSYCNEKGLDALKSNETLEFLGDAVLELAVSRKLFNSYPDLREGELTKCRASLVCEPVIAAVAREIELGECLLVDRGEENCGGRDKDSILSDAFEALIGAIYCDGGYEAAEGFIVRFLGARIGMVKETLKNDDPKTRLQVYIQKISREPLHYIITDEAGQQHDKTFTVAVYHENRRIGVGSGKSKKEASKKAAAAALELIEKDENIG